MAYNPLQGMSPAQQAAHTQATMNVMQANHTQAMALQQLSQQAQNQFGNAYNAYAQQGLAAQQQSQFNAAAWPEQRWMIDGKYMSLHQFVDFMWPEDCADKTFFLLKHTKETK
jgi:hypothetical protein